MFLWRYLIAEEIKAHTWFQKYAVTDAMHGIRVRLQTQLSLFNFCFPLCFKSAVLKENAGAGQ